MDPSGHRWTETGRHSHRVRSREDYSRSGRNDSDQKYPSADPRELDRQWMHPDANRAHFTSPPPRPDYTGSSYITHGHDYHRPAHSTTTPQSRHAYDYPPHSYWDHKGNYGYYDQDYYTAQYGHKDAGQWAAQDLWRSNPGHYERSYHEQEQPGRAYTEQYIYDQQRDRSQAQCYLNESEDHSAKDNEEASSCYPGNLTSSKNSGMSSSSCELSKYINGAEHSDPVQHSSDTEHAAVTVRQMAVPFKYTVPHPVVSFGPAGQLIRVSPGFSTQETPGQLEIHSLEVILGETQEQLEMRTFPGPLAREDLHKIDAIEFAHQRAEACLRDDKLPDRNAAALLWNLLILLCRQNGRIVGSDIAELLVQNSQSDGTRVQDAPTLIDFSDNPAPEPEPYKEEDLLTGHPTSFSSGSSQKDLDSYTKLLLAGRKKEALESAMDSGLWGHALFLASKMDNRSYTTVLNRFTSQLTASDPLQTLFQMLSGRVPAVATCCGNEKWGDWKPHLAILLSNDESGGLAVQQKAIVTMGDTLASRGLLHAAHVCYLTARTPFGVFTQKAARLVLLGSSHRLPFFEFASSFSIQCTELFEYCQTLGGHLVSIPSFQVYKFLYASRLLDYGLVSQAFHYCEVVGKAILQQQEPFLVLSGEVIKLAERLRQCEGQQLSGDTQDPDWLQQLRLRHHGVQMGSYGCNDTYQSPAEGSALAHGESKVCSESDIDDLRSDVQSPKAELLYYRGTEEEDNPWAQAAGQEEAMTALPWGSGGTENWRPQASLTPPVVYAPPTHLMAGSQDSSYHNTDRAEVKSAALPSSLECLPSTTESGQSCSGMTMEIGVQMNTMPETDHNQGGHSQQPITQEMSKLGMGSQPANTKQSTKTGWFGGWFKAKSKDVQNDNSDIVNPAQIEPMPAAGPCPPPPPTGSHTFPAGVNPFSKYAGQQLG